MECVSVAAALEAGQNGGSWKLFQNRPADRRLLNATQDPWPPLERSAPQGLEMSSRGNAPGNVAPHPLSPLPACGERGAEGGAWGHCPGASPPATQLLPSGEHGFTRSRRSPLQPGIRGLETASSILTHFTVKNEPIGRNPLTRLRRRTD
jgi:hypothetical protein